MFNESYKQLKLEIENCRKDVIEGKINALAYQREVLEIGREHSLSTEMPWEKEVRESNISRQTRRAYDRKQQEKNETQIQSFTDVEFICRAVFKDSISHMVENIDKVVGEPLDKLIAFASDMSKAHNELMEDYVTVSDNQIKLLATFEKFSDDVLEENKMLKEIINVLADKLTGEKIDLISEKGGLLRVVIMECENKEKAKYIASTLRHSFKPVLSTRLDKVVISDLGIYDIKETLSEQVFNDIINIRVDAIYDYYKKTMITEGTIYDKEESIHNKVIEE